MTTHEVYSETKNRSYTRRFDHDEARARHAGGEAVNALAREYGVTFNAVNFVVDPEARARNAKAVYEMNHVPCEECGEPSLRVTHAAKRDTNPDGRQLCAKCRGRVRRTRLRFDEAGNLTEVRCSNTDCANGERWQPPSNFPGGGRFRDVRPNGIHSICRACHTRTKRLWRQRTGRG